MGIVYIKEYENINKIKKSIAQILRYIRVESKAEKTFYTIAINENKKNIKLTKKIKEYLERNNINTVVLSDNLLKNEELKNSLYENNIDILDGRKLFKILSCDILKEIYKYKKMDLKNRKYIYIS